MRFNYCAIDIFAESNPSLNLAKGRYDDPTDRSCIGTDYNECIGNYISRHGYSEQFKKYYLIPMVAAPWCIDPDEFSSNFPARALISFM